MHKPLKPGREILRRVMDALLVDAFYPYRGAPSITAEQADNWSARQTISKLLREGAVDLTPDVEEISSAQSFEQDLEETEKRARMEAKPAQSTLFS